MLRKLPKTGWERSKYTILENLTIQFWQIKALLAGESQFNKKNLKLDV
jgi:hypothetical protein